MCLSHAIRCLEEAVHQDPSSNIVHTSSYTKGTVGAYTSYMNRNTYISASAVVFTIVVIVHVYRAVAGLPLMIGDTSIPLWASWLAVIGIGYLAVSGFKLRKR